MPDDCCPKCGSPDVVPDDRLLDRGHANYQHDLQAQVEEHPAAWVFKGPVRSSLRARVCGRCGYTELYAQDPGALLAVHRQHPEWPATG